MASIHFSVDLIEEGKDQIESLYNQIRNLFSKTNSSLQNLHSRAEEKIKFYERSRKQAYSDMDFAKNQMANNQNALGVFQQFLWDIETLIGQLHQAEMDAEYAYKQIENESIPVPDTSNMDEESKSKARRQYEKDIQELADEKKRLYREWIELNERYNRAIEARNQCEKDIMTIQNNISSLSSMVDSIQNDIYKIERKIDEIVEKWEHLQRAYQEATEQWNRLLQKCQSLKQYMDEAKEYGEMGIRFYNQTMEALGEYPSLVEFDCKNLDDFSTLSYTLNKNSRKLLREKGDTELSLSDHRQTFRADFMEELYRESARGIDYLENIYVAFEKSSTLLNKMCQEFEDYLSVAEKINRI